MDVEVPGIGPKSCVKTVTAMVRLSTNARGDKESFLDFFVQPGSRQEVVGGIKW